MNVSIIRSTAGSLLRPLSCTQSLQRAGWSFPTGSRRASPLSSIGHQKIPSHPSFLAFASFSAASQAFSPGHRSSSRIARKAEGRIFRSPRSPTHAPPKGRPSPSTSASPSPIQTPPSAIRSPWAFSKLSVKNPAGSSIINDKAVRYTLLDTKSHARKDNKSLSSLRPLSPFLDQARQSPQGSRVESDYTWLIYTFVGLNLTVFAAWYYADYEMRRNMDYTLFFFMHENFTSGDLNLSAGRWWTLVTCCISQSDPIHLAMNMISFLFMAPPVLSLVGPVTFTGLYFGAGIFSSAISIAWKKYLNPWIDRGPKDSEGRPRLVYNFSHGASGSVYAVMSTFACLMPRATFLLFFVVPMPAWVVVPGIISWDFYSAWFNPAGYIDSAGHLGGALAGLLFWRFRLKGLRLG